MLKSLFSRKKEKKMVTIMAPLTGEAVALEEVPDPVFAQKLTGDGVAIKPTEGVLVSPVSGTVAHLFPTSHAVVVVSDDGLEILMHIGIDTVKLNGEGFQPFVSAGDEVKAGDKLISFDLNLIEQKGYPTITPVVLTNGDKIAEQHVFIGKQVQAGQEKVIDAVLK